MPLQIAHYPSSVVTIIQGTIVLAVVVANEVARRVARRSAERGGVATHPDPGSGTGPQPTSGDTGERQGAQA